MRHRLATRRRPRLATALVAAGVCLLGFVTAGLVPTATGNLNATVTNSSNKAISGILNGPCTSNATSISSAYFVWPFDESTGATTARDTTTNRRTGTYQNTGQITFQAAGPCPKDNAAAITFSGQNASSGYVSTTSTTSIAGPTVFSAAIWFKTNTTTGGRLIGFGSSLSGSSGNYDRHLYMSNAGIIYAGVYPNAVKTVASTAAYNDNTWHFAVMTLAASGSQSGLRLYIDGSLIASDTSVTSAQSYNGFWRVGWDNTGGWTNSPSTYSFAGSVAYASVYTAALTPTQVTSLYNAGK